MEAFVKGVDDMGCCSAGCYLKNKLADYREDAGALEMLNCLEDTKKNPLFDIIVKCALYYARVSSSVIPSSLQLI